MYISHPRYIIGKAFIITSVIMGLGGDSSDPIGTHGKLKGRSYVD
jgi:hypothetical protein